MCHRKTKETEIREAVCELIQTNWTTFAVDNEEMDDGRCSDPGPRGHSDVDVSDIQRTRHSEPIAPRGLFSEIMHQNGKTKDVTLYAAATFFQTKICVGSLDVCGQLSWRLYAPLLPDVSQAALGYHSRSLRPRVLVTLIRAPSGRFCRAQAMLRHVASHSESGDSRRGQVSICPDWQTPHDAGKLY
jgi:hypothetical protein